MAFTIHQQPERLTPANTEHVYTVSSTLSSNTDYKYIFNIVAAPYVWNTTPEFTILATLKVRPNSEGRAVVDISQIVQNFLEPNIGIDIQNDETVTNTEIFTGTGAGDESPYVTKATLNDGFSKANGQSPVIDISQPYGGPYGSAPGTEAQYHIFEYRVMIGEEYIDASGTFVQNGPSNGANYPEEVGQVVPFAIGTWTADYPSIQATDFFGDQFTATADVGVDWYHKDSTETTTYEVGQELTATSTFETLVQPAAGDRMIVKSIYSLYEWVFYWETNPEARDTGWVFLENRYDPTRPYWFGQFMPPSIVTWVGADNTLQRRDYLDISTNPFNENNHLYDWEDWYMNNDGVATTQRGKFLNVGGKEYADVIDQTLLNIREFNLVPGQPIMLSFFNGYCHEFLNDITVLQETAHWANGTQISFARYNIQTNGGGPLVNVTDPYPAISGPVGNKLLHYSELTYLIDLNKSEFFDFYTYNGPNPAGSDTDTDGPYFYRNSASEVLRFRIKEWDCQNDPIFFVFLNSNGAWQSFTFEKKNEKQYEIDRKEYRKGKFNNSSIYSRQSFERKTTTYEQEVEIKVEAQTDYLQEWEARIAEDLIRSTRVFILKDQWFRDYDWGTGSQPGGRINPTMIPVQILNSGVMEYNKNYEKLFQHSIEFTYQNISGYRTSL